MKNSELHAAGTRIYHTLSGDHDSDVFLTDLDMSQSHWELLTACYHQGACDSEAYEASQYFEIKDYDSALSYLIDCGLDESEFKELYDTGDETSELVNNEEKILIYYIWMLAGDIKERQSEEKSAESIETYSVYELCLIHGDSTQVIEFKDKNEAIEAAERLRFFFKKEGLVNIDSSLCLSTYESESVKPIETIEIL